MSSPPHCQGCGREVPTKYVAFYQNIGVLLVRFRRGVRGWLCRTCIRSYFWKYTLLTLVTGWWGIDSFFVNWFFLFNNIGRYIGCLGMPSHFSDDRHHG